MLSFSINYKHNNNNDNTGIIILPFSSDPYLVLQLGSSSLYQTNTFYKLMQDNSLKESHQLVSH